MLLGSAPWVLAMAALPSVQVIGGPHTLGGDEAVEDLVAVDGRLRVDGLIRGNLYAVDSEVTLGPTAYLTGTVTLVGGSLSVEDGAIATEEVYVDETAVTGPGPISTIPLPSTSTTTRKLLKRTLSFRRFAPDPALARAELESWQPGLGFERVDRNAEAPGDVLVGGLLRFSFVSDRIRFSQQASFVGPRGRAAWTALRLRSAEDARALWDKIVALDVDDRLRLSIVADLGDGAHWFVQSRDRSTMFWVQGPWLLAVETRCEQEDDALHAQAFNGQVLRALAGNLPKAQGEIR